MLAGTDELRYALQQLRMRNGHFSFEQICLALARTTIAPNFRFPPGPVSAGGDRGRDFDTFPSFITEIGSLGAGLRYRPEDAAVGVCTLQQRGVRSKVLGDIRKVFEGTAEGLPAPALVLGYCEADMSTGARSKLEADAKIEFNAELKIFDGTTIAELLWLHRQKLEGEILQHLGVVFGRAEATVPRRLPRSPQNFVNRADELADMQEVLVSPESSPTSSVVVLAGLRGVGKSAVAAHWSNSVRDQFSGGDLYLDLARRADPGVPDVGDLLGDLLSDLGVPNDAMPESLDERRRLFEQETVARRLLMFIDNADTPAQVQAALPVGRGSVVVVASNSELDELVRDGARRIVVHPVRREAGREVVAVMAGEGRVDDSAATDRLVELCEGLPIALAACGSQLALRQFLSPDDLVREIESAHDRLAAVSAPDTLSADAVFETAYGALDERLAGFYRLLGLYPGASVGTGAAAALAGVDLSDAEECLEALRRAQLVTEVARGRYEIHGLIRLHMDRASRRDESAERRDVAVERVITWYYRCCRAADFAVQRDRLRLSTGPSESPVGGPELDSPAHSYEWFQSERHNVLAAIRAAEEREMHELVWQFAEALWPLCATQKWYRAWVDSQQAGVRAAVSLGAASAEARVRSQLARAYAELGRHRESREEIEAAHRAARRSSNEVLEASIWEFDGVCAMAANDYDVAEVALSDAHDRMVLAGSARGAALSDYYLAKTRIDSGNAASALELLTRAGPAFVDVNDSVNVARVELRRGEALSATGQFNAAIEVLSQVVSSLDTLGLRFELAEAYQALAIASAAAGRGADALMARQQAYQLYRLLNHPRAEDVETGLTGGS